MWRTKIHEVLHQERFHRFSHYPLSATVPHLNIDFQKGKTAQAALADVKSSMLIGASSGRKKDSLFGSAEHQYGLNKVTRNSWSCLSVLPV